MRYWWRRGHWNGSSSRCLPFFVERTFPRVLSLGRLLKSPTRFQAVPREAKDCPVCQQSFKTHHHLMVHMGVHRGEKFPCSKCGKVLANRRMHSRHRASCVHGKKVTCPDYGKQYSSTQGLKQHQNAKHGADAPDEGTYVCLYCANQYWIRKSWAEHKPYCEANPNWKGPYFCGVAGCPAADHPFNHMRNLNFHMLNIHGWKGMAGLKWIGCWNLGRWVSIAGKWVTGWVTLLETIGGNLARWVSTKCWLGCQTSVLLVW